MKTSNPWILIMLAGVVCLPMEPATAGPEGNYECTVNQILVTAQKDLPDPTGVGKVKAIKGGRLVDTGLIDYLADDVGQEFLVNKQTGEPSRMSFLGICRGDWKIIENQATHSTNFTTYCISYGRFLLALMIREAFYVGKKPFVAWSVNGNIYAGLCE